MKETTKETLKKIAAFAAICLYVLGSIGGLGWSLYNHSYLIAVGVAVYVICVIKLKAITREDCLLLPKGEKIAKLLHL